jgi:hypothetical protein
MVLVIPMPGKKKVWECRSALRPFEKVRPERRYGALRHKSTPEYNPTIATGL